MAEKDAEVVGKRPIYTAVYRHGVDDKRRLQIPSKWRGQTSDLVLAQWPSAWEKDSCLMVVPQHVLQLMIDKLAQRSFGDPDADALRRFIGERSDTVSLDKAGRIVLTESMAKAVGIEDKAVLVGLLDRFQIWNPDRYQASQGATDALAARAWSSI